MGALGVAYLGMLVLALSTAFLAFLVGPALNFVFTGNLKDILHGPTGELRGLWRNLPAGLLHRMEHLNPQQTLWVVPSLLIGTSLVKGAAQTVQFYLLGRTSQEVLQTVRAEAFAALLHQSPSFYARRAHGDLLSRLAHDANIVEQACFYGCGPLFRDTLSVLVLLVFCFIADASLALTTFITVPLAILPLARFTRWLKNVSKVGQAAQGDINAVCYEALAGIRVVQAFNGQKGEATRLQQASARYRAQMLRSYFIRAVRTPTMEALGSLALAGLLAFLGYQVQHRGADPAHYISFFAAIVLMYDPLKKLGAVSDYLSAGAAAWERLTEIIEMPPQVLQVLHAKPLRPFQAAVTFSGVHFSYSTTPVLRGLDLTIGAGEVVALIGASGAGKSTVANLLLRFYDVTGGSIVIDDQDIRDVTLASLRQQISIVNQDTFLFNASVAANIGYGAPKAGLVAIMDAARAAHADAFIQQLPHGYETIIGERGITLSGGQKQRLSIARALLRNSPLLILDEATSSLDADSEQHVQAALSQLLHSRTALVIAHRLSTIRQADRIAVLKEGKIAELGSHEDLLAEGGEYARVHGLQGWLPGPTGHAVGRAIVP